MRLRHRLPSWPATIALVGVIADFPSGALTVYGALWRGRDHVGTSDWAKRMNSSKGKLC